jgi:hypothetical protein
MATSSKTASSKTASIVAQKPKSSPSLPFYVQRAIAGPLLGNRCIIATPAQKQIILAKVSEITEYCHANGYYYLMGGKAKEITAAPLDAKGVDCSGFFRYVLWQATHAAFGEGWLVCDGSFMQNDYFGELGFKKGSHADYLSSGGDKDSILRSCFCKSEDGHAYGHVWLDLNGKTYESCGGVGPSSRNWTTPVLERIIDDYYCLLA